MAAVVEVPSPEAGLCSATTATPGSLESNEKLWREARRSLAAAGIMLLALLTCFIAFISYMPRLPAGDWATLKAFPPRSIGQLVLQRDVILAYAVDYPEFVVVGYSMLYMCMMMFAIPGTLCLSLLAGALYGVRRGLALVALVSTAGAASCYTMSWLIGRPLVRLVWAERLEEYARQVRARRSDMLSYIILLRVAPLLPNTFINVASPIVDVPLGVFSIGTLIGCMPNNFVAVNAGSKLGELKALTDLYDVKLLLLMLLVASLAIGSIFYKRRHERRVHRVE